MRRRQHLIGRFAAPDKMDVLALSAGGKYVAGALRYGTSVAVWEADSGREVARLTDLEEFEALAFDSQQRLLVCDKQRCFTWEPRSGQKRPVWGAGDPAWEGSTGIFAAALAPGRKVLAVSAGQPVLLLDYPGGAVRHRLQPLRDTTSACLAFSRRGRYLAAECRNDAEGMSFVGLWDGRLGRRLRLYEVPESQGVSALAFRPDGRALAVGTDRSIRMFETACEEELAGFRPPAEGLAEALHFSQDGRTLAAMFLGGRCLHLNADTGRVLKVVSPPAEGLEVVALSSEGAVAAGAGAGDLVIWSLPSP